MFSCSLILSIVSIRQMIGVIWTSRRLLFYLSTLNNLLKSDVWRHAHDVKAEWTMQAQFSLYGESMCMSAHFQLIDFKGVCSEKVMVNRITTTLQTKLKRGNFDVSAAYICNYYLNWLIFNEAFDVILQAFVASFSSQFRIFASFSSQKTPVPSRH